MSQKIRFYADEHIAKAIILGLRQRGVDILAVQETGMLSARMRNISKQLSVKTG